MHDYRPLRTLIASIILLACGLAWMVETENTIQALEDRLNHAEAALRRLDPPEPPSGLCVPTTQKKGPDMRWMTKEEYLKQTGEREGPSWSPLPPGRGWAYWWGSGAKD